MYSLPAVGQQFFFQFQFYSVHLDSGCSCSTLLLPCKIMCSPSGRILCRLRQRLQYGNPHFRRSCRHLFEGGKVVDVHHDMIACASSDGIKQALNAFANPSWVLPNKHWLCETGC